MQAASAKDILVWGVTQNKEGVRGGRTPFFGPEGELVSGVLLMV
jgi:hypothetical protein